MLLGAVINDGRLILEGENPLGSEANLVTARENRPCGRASQSRCQRHRKRESRQRVNGCKSSFGPRSRTARTVLFCGWAILDRLHLLRGLVSLLWRDQDCYSRVHGSAG